MPTIDYIRITSILEFTSGPEFSDVTFNIEHSEDQDFNASKTGIITLRLSEIIDTRGFQNNDIEIIASQLIEQVLIRERDEEGTVNILHCRGLPLDEWLLNNTPILRQ
ncbi:MAG: hypothetical protein O7C70_06610 [Candidatus Dadabacteria bacterium]|nr:hypothetical protein [Candidatus Dadabacteria bacterium]MCZ6791451.1 hypothetical protein [Candidatus Dadabacteria bacterium]